MARDFTDLGKGEEFTFKGKTYEIPAISQDTSEVLAELSDKMNQYVKAENFTEANKVPLTYVLEAMAADLSKEDREKLHSELKRMPKRVLSAIMTLIAGEMQGVAEIPEGEEKKKAKK